MKHNGWLLLKTLFLSTSRTNSYRYSGDKKKKRRILGNAVGTGILHLMLIGYCAAVCIGYGMIGIIDAAPVMCALMISALAFVFTFFKTNGYLFNFREYDMLMSLPFSSSTVAACKFLYMYVKSMPWYLSISFSMMIGFGIFARPAIYVYPVWILLTGALPLIPLLAAAFLGFLIARISAGFRKTNLVQTVLIFALIVLSFSARFFLEDMFRNEKVEETLEAVSAAMDRAAGIYLPAGWFSAAVAKGSFAGGLRLIGVSVLLFSAVFWIVGRSYRSINSALRSHAAARSFRLTEQKKRSVVRAIAFKEYKRMMGSTVYLTNVAVGEVLASLLGVVTLLIGFDRIVATVTNGAPFDPSILQPSIPFIVYFFIGMVATTACSPSLEGKNYWIVQSLPIEKKTLYQGKMLFNLYLTVPFSLFSTLCLCLSAKVSALNTVLYLILGLALCAFSTAWGCVCGTRHMRLDWENEVEVVKQGTAVTLYLLPNLFSVMGLTVLSVILGLRMDHKLLALLLILAVSVLALLSYRWVLSFAGKGVGRARK